MGVKAKLRNPKKKEITLMKRLMRKIIGTVLSASSRASLLGFAMTIAISGTARADGDSQIVCGPQTLHGSYVLNVQGFTIVNGVAQPIAVFEGIDFNGDGTFSNPFATVSINGLILRFPPGTGTYTLDQNCEGTLTFTETAIHYDISARPNGREIWMIETDANSVLNGKAEKVSR
jgi:hypothetical protein